MSGLIAANMVGGDVLNVAFARLPCFLSHIWLTES